MNTGNYTHVAVFLNPPQLETKKMAKIKMTLTTLESRWTVLHTHMEKHWMLWRRAAGLRGRPLKRDWDLAAKLARLLAPQRGSLRCRGYVLFNATLALVLLGKTDEGCLFLLTSIAQADAFYDVRGADGTSGANGRASAFEKRRDISVQPSALKEKIVRVEGLRVYLESSRIAELPRGGSKGDRWGPFPEYLKNIEGQRLAGGADFKTEFGTLSAAILQALSRGYKDHNVSVGPMTRACSCSTVASVPIACDSLLSPSGMPFQCT